MPDKTTEELLSEILREVKDLSVRVTRIEDGTAPGNDSGNATVRPPKKQSIKEFLIERPPTDDVQRTLAIGYFMETQEALSSFNKDDIERGYRSAKQPPPANINDKVNLSIKNGHIMEAEEKKGNKKAWVVTSTGEQYILNGYKKPTKAN